MEDKYIPELGQAIFGQPHQEFEVPEIWIAALQAISYQLDTHMWNKHQVEYQDNPFSNSGGEFKNDTFHAVAYSWGDDEQPYNFKWRDIEISWYKYLSRGTSSNKVLTPEMANECLIDCLKSLPL